MSSILCRCFVIFARIVCVISAAVRARSFSAAIARIIPNHLLPSAQALNATVFQLGSIVNFDVPLMETIFKKINMPYTREDFADRLEKATIDTIEGGTMTGDLARISTLENVRKVSTLDFIKAVRSTLEQLPA